MRTRFSQIGHLEKRGRFNSAAAKRGLVESIILAHIAPLHLHWLVDESHDNCATNGRRRGRPERDRYPDSASRYPESGSKVEFRSANILPGGQVASAMVACQQWGLRTRYVGKLGDDSAAKLHRDEFARLGVDARTLIAPGCPSQQAFILVEDSGERTVLWKRDERLTLRPEEIQREWIIDAEVLHVDGHDTAAAIVAAEWANAADIPVVADLDNLYPGVEELLPKIDYLIVSRDIPEKLTHDSDLTKSLPAIREELWMQIGGGHSGPGWCACV